MAFLGPYTDQFVASPVDRPFFYTTDGTPYVNVNVEIRIDGALDMQYQVPRDFLLPDFFCRNRPSTNKNGRTQTEHADWTTTNIAR
jgi:hypothetical protein